MRETVGSALTRREALARGLAATGGAIAAFVWAGCTSGASFGGKIRAGKLDAILESIAANREPVYLEAGRCYLQPYPREALPKARTVSAYGAVLSGYAAGLVALYQRCTHLGCRIPWCSTSQWFECPCHSSLYSRVGEQKGGPAPRGMDRFKITIQHDIVVVDTRSIVAGPPIGTDTTGQRAEGPHCVQV